MVQHNIYIKVGSLNFDDEIVGKHVKVSYTHHDIDTTTPLFLAMAVVSNRAFPFYLRGLHNAKEWIKDTDKLVDRRLAEGKVELVNQYLYINQ